MCKNMVIIHDPELELVCCWLGDKNDISEEAFARKLEEVALS